MDDVGRGIFAGEGHEITKKIIGAFYLVANELGTGFLESVYQRSLCIALQEAGLRVVAEAPLEVSFHGRSVGIFKADIVVEDCVILELKVAEEIVAAYSAQVLHYLRATQIEVGMVLAFGMKARYKRFYLANALKRKYVGNTDAPA